MIREYQRELVRILLDNPELYLPCWRRYDLSELDIDGKRQHLFSMLRMNYAQMGYEVGVISEPSLRVGAAEARSKVLPDGNTGRMPDNDCAKPANLGSPVLEYRR